MRLAVVVLAAGLGTRMNSSLPKVLHRLHGTPMLQYVLNCLFQVRPEKTIVVIGKHAKEIKASLRNADSVTFALQREAKGTGNAVSVALPSLRGFRGTVMIVNGDTPLITAGSLKKFVGLHRKRKNRISVLSFVAEDPGSYGRIIKDDRGRITAIIENRDATEIQKKVREVNSGVYAIESDALHLLKDIPLNASKGEYYLTDIVRLAKDRGFKVSAFCIGSEEEFTGINTIAELREAEQMMKQRMVRGWQARGVRFIDAGSVFISADTSLGQGTTVYPNVHFEGSTRIGKNCTIFPNVRILDSIVEEGATIKDSTLIEGSVVKKGASVGPFAHIRPGSEIGEGARIGNFVEVKKSVIGPNTKASHLAYLGDAKIGRNVNIGAGTITCNYDGHHKHITTVEDSVFIGSDSQLVAPVKVGRGAYVGAGSTITKDVPSGSLALTRVQQKTIEGWVQKRRKKLKGARSGKH
ncbi:MAG: bifunctional UDP-N-acetylglucosamine diphosphorylase/glucosamine-1-phosphate N-acetyltransferase GlmU [Nitrospirota bacterium]